MSKTYPDVPANTLGNLHILDRLPGMRDRAPTICWGTEFSDWSLAKQNEYLRELTCTMNHAAAVFQKENQSLREQCTRFEGQTGRTMKAYAAQGDLMNVQLAKAGAEKQSLYRQIVELTTERDELKKMLKVTGR